MIRNKLCWSVITLLLVLAVNVTGLAADRYLGEWSGYIDLQGQKLDVRLELVAENGSIGGLMDIPAQGAIGLHLADFTVSETELEFLLSDIPGNPRVRATREGDELVGIFSQSNMEFPLLLEKITAAERGEMAVSQEETRARIVEFIDETRKNWDVPGIAVGIILDGEVFLADGFGYRNLEEELPVTTDTIFAIGSSTKAFTTMGISKLADEGKLDWNHRVVDHLPWFRLKDETATDQVTLRDLALHRTGLPRHDMVWYASMRSRKELVESIAHLEPSAGFREGFQYNNLMYVTLGHIIEETTGQTWEEFTTQQILEPLDMRDTNFSVVDSQKSNDFALPYSVNNQEIEKLPFKTLDSAGPAGSINSSLNDMLKWVKAHLSGGQGLISAGRFADLTRPQMALPSAGDVQFSNYALGWMVDSYRGHKFVNHGGNIDGFSALVGFLPGDNIGLVVLANQNGSSAPTIVAYRIIDELLGIEPIDWGARVQAQVSSLPTEILLAPPQIEGTQPSRELPQFAGTYSNSGYGDLEIGQSNGLLTLYYGDLELPLTHWHYDVFVASVHQGPFVAQLPVQFISGIDGQINGVRVRLEATVDPIYFARQADAFMQDPDYLRRLVGEYETMGITITFSVDNDQLIMDIPGQPAYFLEPERNDRFILKSIAGFAVQFYFDDTGKVTSVLLEQPGGSFIAEPIN